MDALRGGHDSSFNSSSKAAAKETKLLWHHNQNHIMRPEASTRRTRRKRMNCRIFHTHSKFLGPKKRQFRPG